MKGSVPLLIWLGKQWLGQTDKQQQDVTTRHAEPADDFRIAGKSRAEILEDLIERLKGETAREEAEAEEDVERASEGPADVDTEAGPEREDEGEAYRSNGHAKLEDIP